MLRIFSAKLVARSRGLSSARNRLISGSTDNCFDIGRIFSKAVKPANGNANAMAITATLNRKLPGALRICERALARAKRCCLSQDVMQAPAGYGGRRYRVAEPIIFHAPDKAPDRRDQETTQQATKPDKRRRPDESPLSFPARALHS